MTVFCQSDECRFNQNGICSKDAIDITYDNVCDAFDSYLGGAEWQEPFWKRMIDPETKQIYRMLFRGKEIEVGGLKFYVDTNSSYAMATEATTGLGAGQRDQLENRIEKIIEFVSKSDLPPLETLPIREYVPGTKKIRPKQEGDNDDEI